MGSLRARLQHAFAVDPPGPAEPTAEQAASVDWFCREVSRRHLTTPALIALEMSRPLSFVASQALQFFAPAVWAIARQRTHEGYVSFAAFLERRGSIDHLARRIEHFEELLERGGRETSGPGASEREQGPPA